MRSKTGMILGLAALGAIVAPMSVQALEFDIGPGGVRVEHGHRWDHQYYNRGECRTIIDHRTNRWGEDVTVRRRICD